MQGPRPARPWRPGQPARPFLGDSVFTSDRWRGRAVPVRRFSGGHGAADRAWRPPCTCSCGARDPRRLPLSLPGPCAETRPADGPVNQHGVPGTGVGGRSTDIRRVNTTSHLGVAFYACRCLRLEEGEAFVYRHSSVSFQCLKQYVELLIKEGLETAISCPDAACPKQGQLQDSEARAGVTGFGGGRGGPACLPGCRGPRAR